MSALWCAVYAQASMQEGWNARVANDRELAIEQLEAKHSMLHEQTTQQTCNRQHCQACLGMYTYFVRSGTTSLFACIHGGSRRRGESGVCSYCFLYLQELMSECLMLLTCCCPLVELSTLTQASITNDLNQIKFVGDVLYDKVCFAKTRSCVLLMFV